MSNVSSFFGASSMRFVTNGTTGPPRTVISFVASLNTRCQDHSSSLLMRLEGRDELPLLVKVYGCLYVRL